MDRDLRIRMLLQAADRVSRPLRDIAGGSTRAAQALKATRDRLKEVERAQAQIAGFRQLNSGLRGTERSLQAAQTRVAQLGQQMRETANPARQMTREFEKAKAEEQRLTRQHENQTRELRTMAERLRAAGVATGDLSRRERELRERAAGTNRELQEQERRLQQVSDRERRLSAARDRFSRMQGTAAGLAVGGAAAMGTGMTIARPFVGGVKEAQAYQSAMTDIAQKADMSRQAVEKMGVGLLAAAKAANQMPADLQAGVDALAGFGLKPEKAAQMMKPIGRAATAYKAEIADLSKAAFAANDNLKVPIEQTQRVIDIMAQAGKSGAFEIKDMAQYFPTLTAGYQALGQHGTAAVADLSAALQIARKGAGDSASAATNVANVLQKIASPATIKAFKKFGVDLPAALKKAYAEGKTPLEAIAELTNKTLGGDLGKIGFLFEDAQVQQGLRPLIQNFEEYKKIRAEAAGASGTTDRDFAERMKDSAEQTKALEINAKVLGVTVGTMLLPTVNAVTQKLTAWANWIGAAAKWHPMLAKGIVLLTVGLAALLIVLGAAGIVLAGLVAPFAALATVATFFEVGMLPVIGIVAGVVAGLLLLGAAGYALYANWGVIAGFFASLWSGIESRFSAARTTIVGIAGGLWSGLKARFAVGGQGVAGTFGALWSGMETRFSAATTTIAGIAGGLWNGLRVRFAVGGQDVANVLGNWWSGVETRFSGASTALPGIASGLWNSLKARFAAGGQNVAGGFGAMWSSIKSQFAANSQVVTSVLSNLWSGMETRFSAAGQTVTGIFQRMWSGVKAIFSMSFADILNRIVFFVGYAFGALVRFDQLVNGWLTGALPALLSSGWNTAWTTFAGAVTGSMTWLTTTLPAMMASGARSAFSVFAAAATSGLAWLTTTLPAMLSSGWNTAWATFTGSVSGSMMWLTTALPAMLASGISSAFSVFAAAATSGLAWLTTTLPAVLSSGWNTAWVAFNGAVTGSMTWLTTALPAMLASGARSAFSVFTIAATSGLAWLTTTLPAMLSNSGSIAFTMFTTAAAHALAWLTTTLPAMLSSGWNTAWTTFKSAISAAFTALPAMFMSLGGMILRGLVSGVTGALKGIWSLGGSLAGSLIKGFRAGADIHSPSRVFHALGGYVIAGLTNGLAANEDHPVQRIDRLSKRLAAAMVVGAAMPAVAAAPGAGAPSAASVANGTRAPASAPITINIYAHPSQDAHAIAVVVRSELEQARREEAAKRRASFADQHDWSDHA